MIGDSKGGFYNNHFHMEAFEFIQPEEVAEKGKDKMPFPDNKNPDTDFDSRFPKNLKSGILNDIKPTNTDIPLVRRIGFDTQDDNTIEPNGNLDTNDHNIITPKAFMNNKESTPDVNNIYNDQGDIVDYSMPADRQQIIPNSLSKDLGIESIKVPYNHDAHIEYRNGK